MQLVVALIILMVVVIVAALALYLGLTIRALFKINAGLDRTLVSVGEIAAKTGPVNGVLDAINTTLVAGRDLLEGLFLKKAGTDAGGLVESAFPGEGSRFLGRVGRHGTAVSVGETYARGEAILGSLIGGPAPPPVTAAPSPVFAGATASVAAPSPAAPAPQRISLRGRSAPASSAPSPTTEAPSTPGRLSAKGSRPWETGETAAVAAPGPSAPPPSPPPPAPSPSAGGGGRISLRRRGGGPPPTDDAPSTPGRVSAKGSRPWER